MLYNVEIEYLGLKKNHKFPLSSICMKDGDFCVMDEKGSNVLFVAHNCKVDQIAANVIIISGFTEKPRHITAFCVYANSGNNVSSVG